jgi:hypothetical protein
MLTSGECRAYGEQQIAEADRNERHRDRLNTSAQAWLFLASQLRRIEASHMSNAKKNSRKRALA